MWGKNVKLLAYQPYKRFSVCTYTHTQAYTCLYIHMHTRTHTYSYIKNGFGKTEPWSCHSGETSSLLLSFFSTFLNVPQRKSIVFASETK